MGRWLLALLVVMVAALPASAQGDAAPKTYTVALDDTLENVIKQLKAEHDLNLTADQTLLTTRVVVTLEDASFMQLLEAICRQVGAVYEAPGYVMPGQPVMWRLREGEWDLDSRPKTEVAGVTVSVEQVNLQYGYSRQFSWGTDESKPGESSSMSIMVRATPQSPELLGRIGGVAVTKAILDTGETLEPQGGARMQASMRRMMVFSGGMSHLNLPAPPDNATSIAELHGELSIYKHDPSGRVEFAPTEIGGTRPFAGANCTLLSWGGDEGTITVTLKVASAQEGEQLMQVQPMAELLGPDGQRATPNSTSVNQSGDTHTYTFGFSNVAFEPTKLVFTGMLLGGPADTHEFVIEDIPLP